MVMIQLTSSDRTDPTSSRVSQMLEEEYVELPFPLNDEYFQGDLAMYVRKSG